MNFYTYAGNDPVNGTDPSGMAGSCTGSRIVNDQGNCTNGTHVDGAGGCIGNCAIEDGGGVQANIVTGKAALRDCGYLCYSQSETVIDFLQGSSDSVDFGDEIVVTATRTQFDYYTGFQFPFGIFVVSYTDNRDERLEMPVRREPGSYVVARINVPPENIVNFYEYTDPFVTDGPVFIDVSGPSPTSRGGTLTVPGVRIQILVGRSGSFTFESSRLVGYGTTPIFVPNVVVKIGVGPVATTAPNTTVVIRI